MCEPAVKTNHVFHLRSEAKHRIHCKCPIGFVNFIRCLSQESSTCLWAFNYWCPYSSLSNVGMTIQKALSVCCFQKFHQLICSICLGTFFDCLQMAFSSPSKYSRIANNKCTIKVLSRFLVQQMPMNRSTA